MREHLLLYNMNMYSQLRRVGVMACKGHQIFYGEGQRAASTGLKKLATSLYINKINMLFFRASKYYSSILEVIHS